MTDSECYVDLFKDTDYRGGRVRIYGPVAVTDLGELHYFDGEPVGNQLQSALVGPNAQVDLRDLDDEVQHLKPSQNCRALERARWSEVRLRAPHSHD